jgi:hypothetical protein
VRTAQRRRFAQIERQLVGSSIYVLEDLSDAELIEALCARTATPAHLKQIYDICAPDLELRLFQDGALRRIDPQYRRDCEHFMPFDTAAELLRYRTDEEPGFRIEWQPYQPEIWLEAENRRSARSGSLSPFVFPWWTHSALLMLLLNSDPLALDYRRRLDEWFDGGNPPVDLLRYPEPREYLLLDPINHPANNCFDIQMLRYPHKDLYFSMAWDRFNEPEDGHVWTTLDTLGRLVIPSPFH